VTTVGPYDVIIGAAWIVSVTALEIVPSGLRTVMLAVPGVAIIAAVTPPSTDEDVLNVVVRLVPLNRTTDPDTKPEPVTLSVNPGPPATIGFGLHDMIDGALVWATKKGRRMTSSGGKPVRMRRLMVAMDLMPPRGKAESEKFEDGFSLPVRTPTKSIVQTSCNPYQSVTSDQEGRVCVD
jgi:hypothetical protein